MIVYIVYTEDGEYYAFSTKEKATKFLNETMIAYAEEIGAPLYEVHDWGYIEEVQVDKY